MYYTLIFSSLLTAFMCWLLIPLAFKTSLVDDPNARKKHEFSTPLIGGLCIFLSSILTMLIFSETYSSHMLALVFGSGVMLALGIIDDKFDLAAPIKLFGQTAIVFIFIVSCDCAVVSLGSPLGFSDPLELGWLSVPFTVVAIVGLTNAINMIDGCDGLASSLVIISLLAMLIAGDPSSSDLNLVLYLGLVCSLFTFLFFNFSKSSKFKAFLGDGGSLFLGFFVAANLVEFTRSNNDYDNSIALWFVAVPIFDFCAVVIRRALSKKGIAGGDRSHIHHYILSNGFSHLQTTVLLAVFAVVLVLFGVFVTSHYPELSFWIFLVLFTLYLISRVSADRQNR